MPAFVVEDGTGLPDATSYASVAEADSILLPNWAVDEPAKQKALMQASDYADLRWGNALRGSPSNNVQSLEFPRYNMRDRYGRLIVGVPEDWKMAVIIYASNASAGTLYPKNQSTDPREIKIKEITVGPIKTKYEYTGTTAPDAYIAFPLADNYAKQYTLGGAGGSNQVIRN